MELARVSDYWELFPIHNHDVVWNLDPSLLSCPSWLRNTDATIAPHSCHSFIIWRSPEIGLPPVIIHFNGFSLTKNILVIIHFYGFSQAKTIIRSWGTPMTVETSSRPPARGIISGRSRHRVTSSNNGCTGLLPVVQGGAP